MSNMDSSMFELFLAPDAAPNPPNPLVAPVVDVTVLSPTSGMVLLGVSRPDEPRRGRTCLARRVVRANERDEFDPSAERQGKGSKRGEHESKAEKEKGKGRTHDFRQRTAIWKEVVWMTATDSERFLLVGTALKWH